jgi:REP element-mobilizing transposase RayT
MAGFGICLLSLGWFAVLLAGCCLCLLASHEVKAWGPGIVPAHGDFFQRAVLHVVAPTARPHTSLGQRPRHSPAHRSNLHAYAATIVRSAGCGCPRVGGTADHVHLATRLSRTIAIADLVEKVKTSSSKWLKTQAAELAAFAWQSGYGVFSLGPADLPALLCYIDDQQQHHRARTFQSMDRAFSPRPFGAAPVLGRCPRLVWRRAFGPANRRDSGPGGPWRNLGTGPNGRSPVARDPQQALCGLVRGGTSRR